MNNLNSILINAQRLGLDLPELLVISTMAERSLASEGEPSTHITGAELAAETGLNYTRVVRAIKKLTDVSLIGREQRAKEKGCAATTTLMPQAFELLKGESVTPRIPTELARLLCGQPEDAILPIISAWQNRSGMPPEAAHNLRGRNHDAIERFLNRQADLEAAALMDAIEQAEEAEALKEQGIEAVETSDGTVYVDTKVFTQLAPGETHWSFVKCVLERLYQQSPLLLTRLNIHHRIAEAAYARTSLNFVRDKAFMDGVRLLAHQMKVCWSKPNRIQDGWYAAASTAINRCSVLHH